ncbi:tail fiber assembly protein [Serratia microhaemolytica]|uniref:tail fiber assembly protein n=1 Tax=Serratia microhaemolytica TaxID=2675110 RepID=UPI000FDE40EA|nr:tail fiber assembly protein [Serratia microhaemolytica]
MNQPRTQLDNNGLATVAGWLTVYNIEPQQREYLAPSEEYLEQGVGLPAYSYLDAPPQPEAGQAIVRTADNSGWQSVADHRGETVYHTANGEALTITALGDYPPDTTLLAPATPFDQWQDGQWVTSLEQQHAAQLAAAKQQQSELLATARATISLWQSEMQLNIISEEDKTRLIAWLGYIKALQGLSLANAPEINWPTVPTV